MSVATAIIITIGDELLSGKTADTNTVWMARELNRLGIRVVRSISVSDSEEAIRGVLDEALPMASVLLMTGGLGPTADDVTKPVLCRYFGGKMITDTAVLEHVRLFFEKRGRPFLERNRMQADVPDVCQVMFNNLGTAPGMWFEHEGKIVVSMPGVPFEMRGIMRAEVLPRLHGRFHGQGLIHRCIVTAGEGESFLAERIRDLEEGLPQGVSLSYLPEPGVVRIWLTGTGADPDSLEQQVEACRSKIAARIADRVIAMEDIPVEEITVRALTARGQTVGLAESCTGGLIGHLLTQVPGASLCFRGGIVCYLEEIKTGVVGVDPLLIDAHGVVSEPVALAMAAGARTVLGAGIGLGITGMLSPVTDSGLPPAGTICIAVADAGRSRVKTFHFHYDRKRNKEAAAKAALLMIRAFILEES